MNLRNKIIAHSDESEMHYRTATFSIDSEDEKIASFNFPDFQFDESLYLGLNDLRDYETMLRRVLTDMAKFFVKVAQENPELLDEYKIPSSINVPDIA